MIYDAIDDIKAVKSAEDIKWIRRAAAMQDEIFAKVRDPSRDVVLLERDYEADERLGVIQAGDDQAGGACHQPYHGGGNILLFVCAHGRSNCKKPAIVRNSR